MGVACCDADHDAGKSSSSSAMTGERRSASHASIARAVEKSPQIGIELSVGEDEEERAAGGSYPPKSTPSTELFRCLA